MDGEKPKVANGGASVDGDASSDGINPPEKPLHVQYFDVDDDEELATPKGTDGSEDTIKSLDEEIRGLRSDRSEMQRRMEEMLEKTKCSEADSRSFAARATELEGELARSQENLNLISNKAESLRLTAEALEADKTILEDRVRDLEARMSDLESEKSKAVSDALMKEAVIKSMKEDLNVEREKTVDAVKNKEDEDVKMEELENWKKEVEMEREKYSAMVREKDEEIVSLKRKLGAVTLNEVEIKSLKEELKTAREKAMEEIDALKDNARVAAAQQDEVSLSLKEELRLAKDNGREQAEMEMKKVAAALVEKEREVVSLKQELLLAREKGIDELEANNREVVADKEAEIFLVKEHLSQAMVDARMREENLESEIKQLKDRNSELEGKIKGLQFSFDSDVAVQGSRGIDLTNGETEATCSKVSWITTAAVAASSGTVAAAVTAFCLHRNKQS